MQSRLNERAIKELCSEIESELSSAALLYRVFGRSKAADSLKRKINKNPKKYSEGGKKIQDILGIRITLYFSDDVDLTLDLLKNKYEIIEKDSAIDVPNGEVFSAKRFNLVFKVKENLDFIKPSGYEKLIDDTFEVQIRTVLSEGWHEVEHDLRYKAQEDWADHDDLDRALNGIYATLETSDWSMIKLFEELSHRHYKNKKINEMMKTKFRLRLPGKLSDDMESLLLKKDLLKKIFRAPRGEVVQSISTVSRKIPLTPDLIVHLINRKYIGDADLFKMEGDILKNYLDSAELDKFAV